MLPVCHPSFTERPRSNYGDALSRSPRVRHRATARAVLAGIALLWAASQAAAQQAKQPGFDPRQTEKRFDQSNQPAKPNPRAPTLAKPEVVTADTKPLFVLRAVTPTGATTLPSGQLASAYQPYLHKMVSQADLATIAEHISDLYRDAGFHLSRAIVPPQDIQDGRVRIRVIEGSITDVELKGDDAARFGVRALLDPVVAESPSRLATLERQLLLINGLPGARITDSTLEEIGSASGHFRLIVWVKTWHVYLWAGLDNLGSASIGPWQSYATGAFNSYLLPGDNLTLNLSTIANDPRELGFSRLSYDAPLGIDGFRLGASALYSNARPGDDRRLVNDNTTTESAEIHGSIVPIVSQRESLTLTVAMGFSDLMENNQFSPTFGPIYNDRIRTISLTSSYRLQDALGGTNYATMTFRQGLDIFGATQLGDDLSSHYGAAPNFSVLNFYYARYQTFSDVFSAKLSTASQIASGPLFTSQQFYLGGAAFGRGYGAAQISGDNGIAGSFELRFDQGPNYRYLAGYQLYAFADAGAVWNDGFRPSDGLALTSVGAGVRFFFFDDLQADIGVALPLSYRASDNPRRDARLLFSLSNALKLCPERGTHCL